MVLNTHRFNAHDAVTVTRTPDLGRTGLALGHGQDSTALVSSAYCHHHPSASAPAGAHTMAQKVHTLVEQLGVGAELPLYQAVGAGWGGASVVIQIQQHLLGCGLCSDLTPMCARSARRKIIWCAHPGDKFFAPLQTR